MCSLGYTVLFGLGLVLHPGSDDYLKNGTSSSIYLNRMRLSRGLPGQRSGDKVILLVYWIYS